MSQSTSTDHSIAANMAPPTVTPPTTSNEVITTMRDNEESAMISPAKTRSYCHVLSVAEVIKLAKRLDLDGSIGQDTANTTKNNEGFQMDGKHVMKPVDVDVSTSAQDGRTSMSDDEHVDSQRDDAACTLRQRPATENSAETALSTQTIISSTETAPESQNATVESTAPVPTIYQPRRANIFKKRGMKRAARPVYVWSQESVARDIAKATETIDDDDGEGFTAEDLQELQSAGAEKMERKTERFLHMVSQCSWRPRRVEDLGEAFAIED